MKCMPMRKETVLPHIKVLFELFLWRKRIKQRSQDTAVRNYGIDDQEDSVPWSRYNMDLVWLSHHR